MSVATRARRLAAPVGRPLRRAAVGLRTRDWEPHSHLFIAQEGADWVLAYEARQLGEARRRARRPGRPRALGERGGRAGDLPREPVHAPPRRLRRPREPPRVRVLPRAARDTGFPGVRRLLRETYPAPHRDRRRPGDQPRDGVARARDGNRRGAGPPDPDRRRPGRLPDADGRRQGARPPGARASGVRLRHRLVPEGRCGLGRGPRAEADQGPGRPRRSGRAAPRARARPVVSPHGPVPWLRQGGARARRHPVPAPVPSRASSPWRGPTRRSTSTSSPRATRGDREPFSSRWRSACPSSRRASGRRPTSSGTGRTAGSSRWRTSTRSSSGGRHVAEAPRGAIDRVLAAGRRTAEENAYGALRPRWRSLLEGLVTVPDAGAA